MDRGAWRAAVHSAAGLDTATDVAQPECILLLPEPGPFLAFPHHLNSMTVGELRYQESSDKRLQRDLQGLIRKRQYVEWLTLYTGEAVLGWV